MSVKHLEGPATVRLGRRIAWVTTRLSRSLNVVAAAVLTLMVVLGIWDVASRELDIPYIDSGADLAALLLATTAFLAWPGVEAAHAHVSSTVLTDRLPQHISRWVVFTGQLISTAVVGWLLLASYGRASEARATGETTVGSSPISVWPVRYVLAIAALLLFLQMLVTISQMIASGIGVEQSLTEGDVL